MTRQLPCCEDDLIVTTRGCAGVIRLNRPKALNALTLDMIRVIDTALDGSRADSAVGVILLEGAGERGLCAGGDIRACTRASRRRRSRQSRSGARSTS